MDLGDRMKEYERVTRTYLTRRVPVIIRLDGKAFKTFTSGLKKPFDEIFRAAMMHTAKYLCENIQGCKFAYTQSDEITLLLTDYENINTEAWYNYNVSKMTSISASMCSVAFNKFFMDLVGEYKSLNYFNDGEEIKNYISTLKRKLMTAVFDSRVFNIPKEEVCNEFLWRQRDAIRNSIQSVARCYLGGKLDNKSNEILRELLKEKGEEYMWEKQPRKYTVGVCVYKESALDFPFDSDEYKESRKSWVINEMIPNFSADRQYIEKHL
ncbi:tRNAHis guanylyltransferase [compost metagenome]